MYFKKIYRIHLRRNELRDSVIKHASESACFRAEHKGNFAYMCFRMLLSTIYANYKHMYTFIQLPRGVEEANKKKPCSTYLAYARIILKIIRAHFIYTFSTCRFHVENSPCQHLHFMFIIRGRDIRINLKSNTGTRWTKQKSALFLLYNT